MSNTVLDFDDIEDAFPDGLRQSKTGALEVSAQWLHDFAHAVSTKTIAKLAYKQDAGQLLAALTEINNWLVCACIATDADMAQSFPAMQRIAQEAIDTARAQEGENAKT